jgi:hypothetical protein
MREVSYYWEQLGEQIENIVHKNLGACWEHFETMLNNIHVKMKCSKMFLKLFSMHYFL